MASKLVTTAEFIRRIIWLSNKFSKCKVRFSIFSYPADVVEYELYRMNIPFDYYYGPNYNMSNESLYDICVELNPNKTQLIIFSHDFVSYHNPSMTSIEITNENEMMAFMFRGHLIPPLLHITNHKKHVRDIINNIYYDDESIEFVIKHVQHKRKRSETINEMTNEIIETDSEITTTITKKIRI